VRQATKEEQIVIFSKTPALRPAARGGLLLLGALLAIAGCGGSSKGTTGSSAAPPAGGAAPSGSTASLEANPEGQLKFNKTSLSAKAGSVSISFTNTASLMHNLTVAGASGHVIGATATFTGGTRILPLNLKPGTYKFYCSVPGHRAAGMEGTLTVQ
jgi:uncharacterized cupredoxin-like copper-binding protein